MNQLSILLKDLGTTKLAAIIGGAVLVLATILLMTFKYSSHNFVPLYGNLDLKDSNEIVKELELQNIPFKFRANGSEILVPDDQVLKMRMKLASSGIPSNGSLIGYEIFDKTDTLGSSNFVQNINLVRALEGELSRTISSLSKIESARVHLVLPKRELFIRDKQQPSASIIISTRGNVPLNKAEIEAIGHLVATAIPGLETNKITIVDTAGRPLKLGNSDVETLNSSKAEEFKAEYEKRLKTVLEDLLAQSVGFGHVKVEVSADINFDRIITNSETYDPDGQVVRSVQEVDEQESSNNNDFNQNVSVANNLPNTPQQSPSATSNSNNQRTDTTTNYEISKTVRNQITEAGTIKRLSIAVLIDGTYNLDPETKKTVYTPRSSTELSQFETLVKSAAGFDQKRGDSVEIVNMQFAGDLSAEHDPLAWVKNELSGIIKTAVIGIIIILILLLVVKPTVSNILDMTKSAQTSASLSASTVTTNIDDNTTWPSQEAPVDISKIEARFQSNATYKSVNEIFNKYPQETLSTIRKWLSKD
ncbi:Flagellar M-ring protein [Rickettsiales bacterium Ac37b]|nr:Flagellar M-ring protein [Rickettsiales bacterium Ac37b]